VRHIKWYGTYYTAFECPIVRPNWANKEERALDPSKAGSAGALDLQDGASLAQTLFKINLG